MMSQAIAFEVAVMNANFAEADLVQFNAMFPEGTIFQEPDNVEEYAVISVNYREPDPGNMGVFKVGQMSMSDPTRKPRPLDELLDLLKRLLDYCLCCLTCGCYPGPKDETLVVPEAELLEEERDAIQNLLHYLDSAESKKPTINDERLQALCVLTYSDNTELQRSAALCFAEISDRMKSPISHEVLEPLVILLQSRDANTQKAASLAISNFAFIGPEKNKEAILNSNAMPHLVQLLRSESLEVQCNTCGCITTLASTDRGKQEAVSQGGVSPLLLLAHSTDIRVQRNATGALLNLTHLQSNRNELVLQGALPVLVQVVHSRDSEVQYYCAAALSNMAVNEKHRAMIVAVGHYDAVRQLVRLLSSPKEKVRCQACLALRNLASDTDNQILIVRLDCLPPLHAILRQSHGETLVAALACLRNLSIHKKNEASITKESFLLELKQVLLDQTNTQAQLHAAGTIRNLAAGDQIKRICQSGCVESLLCVVMMSLTKDEVMSEVTAALAVLADEDSTRQKLLYSHQSDVFPKLLSLATSHKNAEIQYNCAGIIGQLSLADLPDDILSQNMDQLCSFLETFLAHPDPSFIHVSLWTTAQLLRFDIFVRALKDTTLLDKVRKLQESSHGSAIKELARSVVRKTGSSPLIG